MTDTPPDWVPIEEYMAFRREVSDAIEHYASRWPANARRDIFMAQFASFILPKPVDPVATVLAEVMGFSESDISSEEIRAAFEAHGLKITEITK